MIKIEKGKAPEFLSSEKVEIARERMRTFYASNREQKRYLAQVCQGQQGDPLVDGAST